MTTSSNIANVIKPIGMLRRPCSMCGMVFDVNEIPKRKKNKNKIGVYEILNIDGITLVEEAKEKKYTVNGKKGVWRTIKGRHYFFPDDGSGTIPPIKNGKQ